MNSWSDTLRSWRFGLAVAVATVALAACGGGTTTQDVSSVTLPNMSTAANVVPIEVRQSGTSSTLVVNMPYVTVTVCAPAGQPCAAVTNVLVDTGSSGLRLFDTAVQSLGLPTISADAGGTLGACAQFASGYVWGAMHSAVVQIGGETTSGAIPVQIVDDPGFAAPAPYACTSTGQQDLAGVFAGSINGMIGVGNLVHDCGSVCTKYRYPNRYFNCVGTSCSSTTAQLSQQGINPVAAFPVDNNGSILTLPAVTPPETGASSATGMLAFGIGTQSNNALPANAQVYPISSQGYFLASVDGGSLGDGFVDSGSNGNYLDLSGVASCSHATGFYCPSTPQTFSITTVGSGGSPSSTQTITVANAQTMFNLGYAALPALAGGAAVSGAIDLGLPFFYGRSIATALEDPTSTTTPHGYWAY